MPKGDVTYPDPLQVELGIGSLETIYTVTAGQTAIQLTIIVCNFTAIEAGYDLKARPSGEATANKHFWRGSATAEAGRLPAGATEVWRLNVRPGASWIIEGEAGTINSIAVTISPAEKED